MTFPDWSSVTGYSIPILAFLFTLWKWLEERREKRVEREKRLQLEREMDEIRRRGRAPFLRAKALQVPGTETTPEQSIGEGGDIAQLREVPDGSVLLLRIANLGEAVRCSTDDWPPPYGFCMPDAQIPKDDFYATELKYVYKRSEHGQTRQIKLSFETLDGLKLHQAYETKVGFCYLVRIDPR